MRIYEKSVSFVRLNQNLEPNWQLFEEMSIFSKNFGFLIKRIPRSSAAGSFIAFLPLTLNVEP